MCLEHGVRIVANHGLFPCDPYKVQASAQVGYWQEMEEQHHLERDVRMVAQGHRRLRALLQLTLFLLFALVLYACLFGALPMLNDGAARAYRHTWRALWNCTRLGTNASRDNIKHEFAFLTH